MQLPCPVHRLCFCENGMISTHYFARSGSKYGLYQREISLRELVNYMKCKDNLDSSESGPYLGFKIASQLSPASQSFPDQQASCTHLTAGTASYAALRVWSHALLNVHSQQGQS